MDADWITSPTARRILLHWADPRPAWLWSADGVTLLWRNIAARYFYGKVKKHGVKLSPEATPIKGQVPRILRMGTLDRSSLSRIQFLIGEKPVSATCMCTPLVLADGQSVLLAVGVDAIDAALLQEPMSFDSLSEDFLPKDTEHLLLDEDGQITGGSAHAVATYAPTLEANGLPEFTGEGTAALEDGRVRLTRLKASPGGASLLLFETGEAQSVPAEMAQPVQEDGTIDQWSTDHAAESGVSETADDDESRIAEEEAELLEDDLLSSGVESESWREADEIAPEIEPENDGPSAADARSLTKLFDSLSNDERLFAPLDSGDDEIPGSAPEVEPARVEETPQPVAAIDNDGIEASPSESVSALYKVTGRGFMPFVEASSDVAPGEADVSPGEATVSPGEATVSLGSDEQPVEAAPAPPPDSESVERVSRYNFDELARILNDRVGAEGTGLSPAAPQVSDKPRQEAATGASEAGLVTLGGETFVLNRLPLGILVFRDQQVLFANRALTDLTGHESIESLRQAGIGAMFPAVEAVSGGAGPLHHLVKRDGMLVPVNARLQTISWHGRPALMLSASLSESTLGHEAAVRAFAEIMADASEDGFIGTDRSGTITALSGHASVLLGRPAADFLGRPLSAIVSPQDTPALKSFFERPARFAETARPGISLGGAEKAIEILLFAEGQAGIVSGYFGFLRRRPVAVPAPFAQVKAGQDVEPGLLSRVSRGIRRPLNSILGFADLIASPDALTLEPARTLEYAGDIRNAGTEIAALVDELDDYARLKDGRYPVSETDTDLGGLLDAVIGRVRNLANEQRVLVRSSVSENLPRIRADQPSLTQALLNLFASAIDQTQPGGSVVLSAKWADDGGIDIHLRSSAELSANLPDQFVVFRDGTGKTGEPLAPVRSSVGLSLTRALLAVNSCSLSVDPTPGAGTLFSLLIPGDLVLVE